MQKKDIVSSSPERKTKKSSVLRTGKIYAKKASASEILRSVGVRPADAKVAEKALRAVDPGRKSLTTIARKTTKISTSTHRASGRTIKNR